MHRYAERHSTDPIVTVNYQPAPNLHGPVSPIDTRGRPPRTGSPCGNAFTGPVGIETSDHVDTGDAAAGPDPRGVGRVLAAAGTDSTTEAAP